MRIQIGKHEFLDFIESQGIKVNKGCLDALYDDVSRSLNKSEAVMETLWHVVKEVANDRVAEKKEYRP